jgi:parvulin-like peptidyl-prolyl isomerase
MRKIHVLTVALALLGLALAGCGGGNQNVPDGAVAVVDGEEITKAEFDALMARAKTSYANNKQEFPKAGTPEYRTLQNQAIAYLVQQEKYRQEAEELDVEVTQKEIDDRVRQLKQQYFGGNDKQYRENLKSQGLTDAQIRQEIESQLISEKIYANVTEGVKVTDAEIEKYYNENKAEFKTAASRDVRHILVAKNKKALADDLRRQLQDGAAFATLARRHSTDPGSKSNGGKLTIRKGETVPEFDKVAFQLDKGEISQPVETQYGWHIIEALTDVKAEKQTPLAEVKEQIRQQLLQERRQEAITEWSKELNEEYEDKISYQVGFSPPATTGTTADQ